MRPGNYLSITLDDLAEPILVVLHSSSKQGWLDEATEILQALGGWCEAHIVSKKEESTIVLDVEDKE